MAAPVFRRGDIVECFYRMGCDDGGYFPVTTSSAGTLRPRFGRTDGWMTARVDEDWPPPPTAPGIPPPAASARVRVRHMHPFWSNRRGERLDPFEDRDMVVFMLPADVRRPAGPGYQPALSLLVVRWGGEQTQFNTDQWGAASASVSDEYVEAVLDQTLYRRLGPNYEVISAFIESGADMLKLQPSAVVQLMNGRHLCALYFLWPVMAQDGGDIEQSGMVSQSAYFSTLRGFEAAGVPTRFPHASQLYETLLAKDWQASLCLFPRLRIPPTVIINRAAVVRSPRTAASHVLDALASCRSMRYESESAEPDCLRPMEGETRKGVVKLGFAWEAAHVRIFRGEAQLAEALQGLVATPGVESTALIVQDFCKNHFEMRCFVINGRIEHLIYSTFERVDPDGYVRDFLKLERAAAISSWFAGDTVAMEDAERKASRLVRHWLTWLRCRSAEPTIAFRCDLLITRASPGKAEVHTLELTEMGFSMLAWPEGPHVVFNALVDSFFADLEPTAADQSVLAGNSPARAAGGKGGRESSPASASTDRNADGKGKGGKPKKRQKKGSGGGKDGAAGSTQGGGGAHGSGGAHGGGGAHSASEGASGHGMSSS